MAKRLKVTKSKNSASFYIIDDFYDPKSKKKSTYVVEKLGNLARLREKYQTDSYDEVIKHLQDYVEALREAEQQAKAEVTLAFHPNHLIACEPRLFNIGYLYIKNIICFLGFKEIGDEMAKKHRIRFDFTNIIIDVLCHQILKGEMVFYEAPQYKAQDAQKALRLLAQEKDWMILKLEEKIKDLNQRNVMIDPDYCAEHLLRDHAGILGTLSVKEADNVNDVFNKIMAPVEYLLVKKALKGKYTYQDVINHLATLNVVYLGGISYVPAFTRTAFTDDLVKAYSFQPSYEILFQHDLKRWMRVVNAQNGMKLE